MLLLTRSPTAARLPVYGSKQISPIRAACARPIAQKHQTQLGLWREKSREKITQAPSLQLQDHAEIKRKQLLCCNPFPTPKMRRSRCKPAAPKPPSASLHLVCYTHVQFSVETAKMEGKRSSHISPSRRSQMKAVLPLRGSRHKQGSLNWFSESHLSLPASVHPAAVLTRESLMLLTFSIIEKLLRSVISLRLSLLNQTPAITHKRGGNRH